MSDEEKELRELLEEAGPRPPLAETDLERIRGAARAEWRGRWASGRSGSRRSTWAAAAALLLGAATLLLVRRAPTPAAAPGVATVERVTGDVAWTARGTSSAALSADAVGRAIPEGAAIETRAGASPGRLALRMAGGASVRLDAATRVKLASASVVELESGAIYVDTGGPAAGHESVAVRTGAGVFRSIGTQFEVQAEGGATRLRVREGRVRLDRGADSLSTEAGQELVVRRDGTVERRETAADGPEWEWIVAGAPMPDIEGVKVRTFLDWLARERGWRVEFADAETAALADSVVLHGSIAHLTPIEAPDVVLPSSGLGYRVAKGKLVVFAAGDAREPVRTPR
jgi:ferric-dicitrate binding protein FerR (iron transport regulator)